MSEVQCMGCGGWFPDVDGPTHRYMESSPGCWAAFGQILAREYSDPAYYDVHRLSVDAYAVQHPGSPSRLSIQSVAVHLIRLCLFLEHGLSPENANQAMLEAAKHKDMFVWLNPPESLGPLTAADVVKAASIQEHKALVRAWAEGAWAAWFPHHDTIRSWLAAR
ncbi:DUF5946 family protein [Oceanithermus desulfurans]